MKKSLLVGAALVSISTSSFAYNGAKIELVECRQNLKDAGVKVNVIDTPKGILAIVSKTDKRGTHTVGEYRVTEGTKNNSHRIGAPLVYTGKNFELEIKVSQSVNGRTPGHLAADSREGRFSEEVVCTFTR